METLTTSVTGTNEPNYKKVLWPFFYFAICAGLVTLWGSVVFYLLIDSGSSTGALAGLTILLIIFFISCSLFFGSVTGLEGLTRRLKDTAFKLTLIPLAKGIIRFVRHWWKGEPFYAQRR